MEVKILVASPTFEGMKYCEEKFLDRIKNLEYKNYDILIVDNSRGEAYFNHLKQIKGINVVRDFTNEEKSIFRLISSRNLILDYALKNNYTHLLMLDSDVIPPTNFLTELVALDKDIVSGIYNNYFNISRKIMYLPIARKIFTKEEFEELKRKYPQFSNQNREDLMRHLTPEEIDSNDLFSVDIPAAGCMLIKRKVFKKVRYGKLSGGADDDIYFIKKAKEFNFQSYCYTKIKCKHIIKEKYKKDENGNWIHSSFSDLK